MPHKTSGKESYEVFAGKTQELQQDMPIMGKDFANNSMDDMFTSSTKRGNAIREMKMPVGNVSSPLLK